MFDPMDSEEMDTNKTLHVVVALMRLGLAGLDMSSATADASRPFPLSHRG